MLLRIITLSVLAGCLAVAYSAESEIITEPRPGEEYVFVSGGQPQEVRTARQRDEQLFETAHKIPEKLPTHHVNRQTEDKPDKYSKTKIKLEKAEFSPIVDALISGHLPNSANIKRESGEGIIEIQEDKKISKDHKKKVITKEIEVDVPLSKIETIKIHEDNSKAETNPQMHIELEPMSQSGKLIETVDVTTQKPVLTTGAPSTPRSFDVLPVNLESADSINGGLLGSDIPLEVAGSEQKQHSRIQIKKGPNGQDYEYEYVYYYYDEDEDAKKTEKAESAEKKPVEETTKVHNSHDGPQNVATNQINNGRNKNKYSTIERGTPSSTTTTSTTTSAPDNNEVLPTASRNRFRGRNIPQSIPTEEDTNEERLPANTRFPPRSRNLNTTPSNVDKEDDAPPPPPPSRQRGKPHHDNNAEETTGHSRSKSRSNVKRPSLELVDSASFNTHASDVPVSQYKEAKQRPSAKKEEDNEKEKASAQDSDIPEDSEAKETIESAPKSTSDEQSKKSDEDTTEITTMAAMDKVALELYAILAGENLNNEIASSDNDDDGSATTTDSMEEEATTTDISFTTEEVTIPTTTTTTTTTPAPTTTTTTTTTAAPTTTARGSRFKGRGVPGNRRTTEAPVASSSAAVDSAPSKPQRGRYGVSRPAFGKGKSSAATPAAPAVEEKVNKQEAAPVQKSLPGRTRFGSRSRLSTTAAPADSPATESSPAVTPRPRLRPTFNLRGRRPLGGASTTAAAPPSDNEGSENAAPEQTSAEVSSTTARAISGRGRLGGNIRPLRPGPRLTLGGRTSTTTTTEATAADAEPKESNSSEQSEATTQPAGESTAGNPLNRLRGRPRLTVTAARPKPTSAPAIRRQSPLLARRKVVPESSESGAASTEASSTEVSESSQEASSESGSNNPEGDEAEAPASEEPITEAPKGLSSLFAGRRRLANRKPGTIL